MSENSAALQLRYLQVEDRKVLKEIFLDVYFLDPQWN